MTAAELDKLSKPELIAIILRFEQRLDTRPAPTDEELAGQASLDRWPDVIHAHLRQYDFVSSFQPSTCAFRFRLWHYTSVSPAGDVGRRRAVTRGLLQLSTGCCRPATSPDLTRFTTSLSAPSPDLPIMREALEHARPVRVMPENGIYNVMTLFYPTGRLHSSDRPLPTHLTTRGSVVPVAQQTKLEVIGFETVDGRRLLKVEHWFGRWSYRYKDRPADRSDLSAWENVPRKWRPLFVIQTLWLDPQIEWRPRRAVIHSQKDGRITVETRVTRATKVGGIWFPWEGAKTYYGVLSKENPSRTAVRRYSYEMLSAGPGQPVELLDISKDFRIFNVNTKEMEVTPRELRSVDDETRALIESIRND